MVPQTIGVLLMEDRPDSLLDVEQVLQRASGLTIVGRFMTARENVKEAVRMKPNLVVMDLTGPTLTGVRTLQDLKDLAQPPTIVVLSDHDHPHFHAAARAVGADASIARSRFDAELLPLIRRLFTEVI